MKKPYVGITGFMDQSEVLSVLKIVPVNTSRLVMVGVLASSKTIQGIPNKWPNRYPPAGKIAEIFPDDPRVLNLIHYNTKELDTLLHQLIVATELGGENLHGFQLNIAWPCPDVIRSYKKIYPVKQIVLQIGGHAFEMVDHSPDNLAEKVADYEGIIDYVLLDASGGYGKPLDTERIREYLYALGAKKLDIGLGASGGLGPATLHLIKPLVREFTRLSIDVERLVRTPEDHLDIDASKEYLRRALLMFP